jgi:16S rRNA C1402 N4-methylase RsmH
MLVYIYNIFLEDFVAITKKVVTPSKEEIAVNPRSRSAKLRVLEKLVVSSRQS